MSDVWGDLVGLGGLGVRLVRAGRALPTPALVPWACSRGALLRRETLIVVALLAAEALVRLWRRRRRGRRSPPLVRDSLADTVDAVDGATRRGSESPQRPQTKGLHFPEKIRFG